MRTIAHKFLDIEAEGFKIPRESYKTLDYLLSLAKMHVGGDDIRKNPEKALSQIGDLLKWRDFSYNENKLKLLNESLQKKEINCKETSLLYCAIAESLAFPIYMVLAPKHSFVRWDDGKKRVNWETTTNGYNKDRHYKKKHNISKKSIKKGVYLRNLTKEEVLSTAYQNIGDKRYDSWHLKEALDYYNKAIELFSLNVGAYSNRALTKMKIADEINTLKGLEEAKKYIEEAITDYTKSIELDPNYPTPYFNRGTLKKWVGDYKGCEEDHKTYKKLKRVR